MMKGQRGAAQLMCFAQIVFKGRVWLRDRFQTLGRSLRKNEMLRILGEAWEGMRLSTGLFHKIGGPVFIFSTRSKGEGVELITGRRV